jgi:NAD(P)-dependent dehydrogenase (short-subunit alcohol dehydrogenase family)
MSLPDLTARRVVVTGGASGMGAAVVCGFPALGARVVSMDRRDDEGKRVADSSGASFVHCNVADEASVSAAFAAAETELGGLDVLIHAAGVPARVAAADTALSQWDDVMSVNAAGTFLVNRAAYRLLRESRGMILNFASAAGIRGAAGWGAYAASKGAVLSWSRSIAAEWAADGIRVNCVAPNIATPMFESVRAEMSPEDLAAWDAQLNAAIPLGGRPGDAQEDLVPVLAFLSTRECKFMTGQVLCVDGGQVMVR